MSTTTIANTIASAAEAAKRISRELALLPTQAKNDVLEHVARELLARRAQILTANRDDLESAERGGLGRAKLERLRLTDDGLETMAEGVLQIATLPDPVGALVSERTVPSGLIVRKVRCPLGVVMMIYESRPNVTIDAFALCFKAGNAAVLKGGREAAASNKALADVVHDVLQQHGVGAAALSLVPKTNRDELREWLAQTDSIDLVIPRGGAPLIEFVRQNSKIPTVQHFHGVCHIYVDDDADLDKALQVCVSAKTSAPATCNAVEAILVHESIADVLLPQLVSRLLEHDVEVRGDPATCERSGPHAAAVIPATDDDWGTEYLDRIVALKCVADLDAAIAHIARHGSNHTDAIITENSAKQSAFTQRVQSSCVLVNASTRFNDGMQLGLGAEIGISTSRTHAYGPMGLEELTVSRYVVYGDGHSR